MIRNAARTVGRGVGVVLATVIELAALSVWFGLAGSVELLSAASAVGAAALAAGLLVEELLTHLTVNGRRQPIPAVRLAALALAETLLWVGWLAVARWAGDLVGVALAGVALAVALVPRHTALVNLLRGKNPLSSVVERATVGFAVLEAAGATAWFLVVVGWVAIPVWVFSVPVAGFSPRAVVGAAVLAGALFVQHVLEARVTMGTARKSVTVSWRSSTQTIRE